MTATNPFAELSNQLTHIEKLLLEIKEAPTQEELRGKLTVQEVAQELGVTPLTVHNQIKKGNLPAYRMGRRVYIRRPDLDKAMQGVKSLKYKR